MASKGSGAVHLLDAQRGAEGTCWSSGQEGQTGSPGQRKAKMCWFSAGCSAGSQYGWVILSRTGGVVGPKCRNLTNTGDEDHKLKFTQRRHE